MSNISLIFMIVGGTALILSFIDYAQAKEKYSMLGFVLGVGIIIMGVFVR